MDVDARTVPTRVRDLQMTRHSACFDPDSRLVLVASTGGPPTLWQRGHETVLQNFRAALGRPDPETVEAGLRTAYARARASLLTLRESILGPGPDVMLLAAVVFPARVAVAVGGAGRAYLHQGREHKRLTAFEDLAGGLVDNPEPWIASSEVRAGDLLLAGSLEAFELPAIGAVAARLATEPQADVGALVDILLQPSRDSGAGAAAVVARCGT